MAPAEWATVAALNHPGIVTIHSVDDVDGRVSLTMELVDGKPLSELIPRGGLSLDRLLAIAVPLMEALSAAHARGITHRDLKPANVMVTADGHVKVLDFGLAKPSDVAGSARSDDFRSARRDHRSGPHSRDHRLHVAGPGRRQPWTRDRMSSHSVSCSTTRCSPPGRPTASALSFGPSSATACSATCGRSPWLAAIRCA